MKKAFICIATWLSCMMFIMLVVAAIFNKFYYNSFVSISIPIPHQSIKKEPLDTVQLDCLAKNIYYEARGESAKGKMMVAMVVIERTRSPHFPATICGVVHQANTDSAGRIIKNQCAFSWYCSGKPTTPDFSDPVVQREWAESYTIAKLVMSGKIRPTIDMDGVTHYHANYVKPSWSRNKNYKLVARIGDHLFYRWKMANKPKLLAAN